MSIKNLEAIADTFGIDISEIIGNVMEKEVYSSPEAKEQTCKIVKLEKSLVSILSKEQLDIFLRLDEEMGRRGIFVEEEAFKAGAKFMWACMKVET